MRLGRRVARILFWGLVLCFTSLAGGLWCAYSYITDSETISKIIREHAVRYLPRAILDPGRVRPRVLAGELTFHDLRLRQAIDGDLFKRCGFPSCSFRSTRESWLKASLSPAGSWSASPHYGCAVARTGPGTFRACSLIPGPARGSKHPPSRSVTAPSSSIPATTRARPPSKRPRKPPGRRERTRKPGRPTPPPTRAPPFFGMSLSESSPAGRVRATSNSKAPPAVTDSSE